MVDLNLSDKIKRDTLSCYQAINSKIPGTDIQALQNRVVELNMKLVSVALNKYKPYTDDQFQIGCIGLINASRTFEITREVPFASYAVFCIERAIQADYNVRKETIEERFAGSMFSLDGCRMSDGEEQEAIEALIADPQGEAELQKYIEENELTFMCNNIIHPILEDLASRGLHMKTKINHENWKKLEFLYIMDLIVPEAQRKGITFTKMAIGSNVSIQNVRTRHAKVMEELFQRMWEYMTLGFNDLFERLRGKHKVPEKLLVLDPGKTTGWCLFVNGRLNKEGQVENCYDDNNINTEALYSLFNEIQPDMFLYEDYKVYAHKLERHTFSPVFTLRLIGAIEAYCQINKIKTYKQMAGSAKNFVTDEKLKSWGFWQTGQKHARDAVRHGCYFLLFYHKGEDIM